jgi:hypothetical protein
MKFDCVMKISGWWIAAAWMAGGWLSAQEPGGGGRQVRLLPVGDLPPFRQEIRDGVRYEIEPPPGSIPPREVVVSFGKGKDEAVPLRLGQISAPLAAPAGGGELVLRGRDRAADAEPWLRVNRPEAGDFLVILWRDPQAKSWEAARTLVLPDDRIAAPAGSVRYVNLSPEPVGIRSRGEGILLEPGKILSQRVAAGAEQPFEVMGSAGGVLKRIHAGVVVQNAGERSLVIIHRADGISPRRPLKVMVRREPAPAAPGGG